jgi:hypothetical protein
VELELRHFQLAPSSLRSYPHSGNTAMESDCRNLLEKLDEISRTEISNLFNGTGDVGGRICDLCLDINKAIDMFINPKLDIDLSDAATLTFLRCSLPTLIEILIRRFTLRCVCDLETT